MHYVDEPNALAERCARWADASVLAVDTEFERSVTYYPRPALVQVADGDDIWLVDPLALDDLRALGDLFASSRPTLLMHSALEDLTVLERATGRVPETVFDTQLAAAFAGVGFGLGYHALVKTLLDVEVVKDQTRSDWLRRPLSDAQLVYAAADVEHLHALHGLLAAKLDTLGRTDWLAEETARIFARAREDEVPRIFVRLAARVDDDAARGALLALVEWREQQARERDRPRRHIADDPLLVELAARRPRERAALEALPSWGAHRGRIGAKALLEASAAAEAATPLALPPHAQDLTPYKSTLAGLKRIVRDAAAELSLDPGLLAPRRLLEKAVVHARLLDEPGLPEEFQGWRAAVLREPMIACLGNVGA